MEEGRQVTGVYALVENLQEGSKEWTGSVWKVGSDEVEVVFSFRERSYANSRCLESPSMWMMKREVEPRRSDSVIVRDNSVIADTEGISSGAFPTVTEIGLTGVNILLAHTYHWQAGTDERGDLPFRVRNEPTLNSVEAGRKEHAAMVEHVQERY